MMFFTIHRRDNNTTSSDLTHLVEDSEVPEDSVEDSLWMISSLCLAMCLEDMPEALVASVEAVRNTGVLT